MFKKKFFIGSLSLMFALSGIGAVQAEGDQGSKSTASKVVELDPNGNAFLTDLTDDGYAELGRYKVEKIKIIFITGMREQKNFLVVQQMRAA